MFVLRPPAVTLGDVERIIPFQATHNRVNAMINLATDAIKFDTEFMPVK